MGLLCRERLLHRSRRLPPPVPRCHCHWPFISAASTPLSLEDSPSSVLTQGFVVPRTFQNTDFIYLPIYVDRRKSLCWLPFLLGTMYGLPDAVTQNVRIALAWLPYWYSLPSLSPLGLRLSQGACAGAYPYGGQRLTSGVFLSFWPPYLFVCF